MTTLTKEEVSDLLNTYLPLFQIAARKVFAPRTEEIRDEIAYTWYEAYQKSPEKALRVFEQPDAGIYVWAKWRAMEIVRKWTRNEEESLDAILDTVNHASLIETEWGFVEVSDKGEQVIATCDYLIDEDDLNYLFRRAARRGEVDSADLVEAYQMATDAKKFAIRKFLSGYAKSEMGKWGYDVSRTQLQLAH